jgi:hypothetical protein
MADMNKYLVLYLSEGALTGPSVAEMFRNSTPEQMAAGMAAWQTVAASVATPGKTFITGIHFFKPNLWRPS